MVLEQGKGKTLDTNIHGTQTETNHERAATIAVVAAMEKLLHQLQTLLVSSLGPPLEPTTLPSEGIQLHALLSTFSTIQPTYS